MTTLQKIESAECPGDSDNRPWTIRKLRKHARRLIAKEISFVCRSDKERFGEDAIQNLDDFLAEIEWANTSATEKSKKSSGRSFLPLPDHLLTHDQEKRLFLHMNDLKRRANALRSRLNPERPSRARIDEMEDFLCDAARIRECLCESNLRLVLSIARKLSNSRNQFEELVSEGVPILLRCVELFDASRGYRFSTYVTHSVQRHLYRVLQRTQRRRHRFNATDADILSNAVEDREERSELQIDHAAIVDSLLATAKPLLDSREQVIIQRRFGLDGTGVQTLRQIAGDLGVSKERVRQLQIRALDKLHGAALKMNINLEPI